MVIVKRTYLNKGNIFIFLTIVGFFVAYLILSIVKHNHYLSGFDLAVVSQYTWLYSGFKAAISTTNNYPFTPSFYDHLEFIYIFLSPFYWLFSDARTLIILQALFISLSALPLVFLMKKYKINTYVLWAILISYLSFYGIQNAIWDDVHSLVFATTFLAFFIYFLDKGSRWATVLFFFLAILTKEDIAILTFLISLSHFIFTRKKFNLLLMFLSFAYFYAAFFLWFANLPIKENVGQNGSLSGLNLYGFIDNNDKRSVIAYSLGWFGFLPLLSPTFLLPALGDLAHYFLLGEIMAKAQTIFMHYRVTLSILLVYPAIMTVAKYKFLNRKYFAFYILFFALLLTYFSHSPLTYLTKQWFWSKPSGVENINQLLKYLPKDATVVSQNNITPHISERSSVFTFWPEIKTFPKNSPCRKLTCNWFRWAGNPEYLIIDTSPQWNILNLLTTRENYLDGLNNLRKVGVIKIYKQVGSATLYKIARKPS